MMRIVVICDRHRAPALKAFGHCFDVIGTVGTAKPLRDMARIDGPEQAIDAGVQAVIALTPSAKLGEWNAACQTQQIPLISAGPMSPTDPNGFIPGRWRHNASLERIAGATKTAQMGTPVFLRHTCCGDGLHGIWWSLLDSLDFAHRVLGQPRRLLVGVSRRGSRWHAAVTVTTADGKTAHLQTTPAPHPGSDAMLLTSGGLAWNEASADSLQDMDGNAIRLDDEWPDARWAQHGLQQDAEPPDSALPKGLLTMLRRASRNRTIETLEL